MNLNNFGDPTLNPNLAEMVKYAKSKGILDVFFHTNGLLLTKDLSTRLIKAGLDRIVVSFDSPYKEKYEKVRVGAKYETVLKNIQDLFKARKEQDSVNPLIRINMIKFPDLTTKEVEDMKDLFLDVVDSIGFLELEEYDEFRSDLGEFPEGYKSTFICPQLLTRLTILENGTVVPCCIDLDAELMLGDVNDMTLKQIWESEKLKNIRKMHLKGQFYKIPRCRNCDWAVQEDLARRDR